MYLTVPLATVEALQRARLDLAHWRRTLQGFVSDAVYRVAPVDDATWRVRMFAPDDGIAEDAATRSAAAALAGWLASRSRLSPGTQRWTLLQGEEIRRPSRIELEADVDFDGAITAVRVGGAAVMSAKVC